MAADLSSVRPDACHLIARLRPAAADGTTQYRRGSSGRPLTAGTSAAVQTTSSIAAGTVAFRYTCAAWLSSAPASWFLSSRPRALAGLTPRVLAVLRVPAHDLSTAELTVTGATVKIHGPDPRQAAAA